MSERSVVELLERVRSERAEAWERASLFARHADRLENALKSITDCPCCERDHCSELANLELAEANRLFIEDWKQLKEITNADV